MDNINYSLVEYFENKYPICEGHHISETGKLGYEEYNKLITDLWKLFTPYNLKIYSDVYNPLNEKNAVCYSTEFKDYVFDDELACEDGHDDGNILKFTGFTNITPEIFLEDIKDILEKYSVAPTKAGEPTKGLNSVESVFLKYIEVKTPPHIVKLRKSHQDRINNIIERENKTEWELKQYKELKELQDMKDLIEKNKSLMEENIKLVEREDIRKKVQQWLENNSSEINFKIGKELYDIIN